jgi:hypothetical protein
MTDDPNLTLRRPAPDAPNRLYDSLQPPFEHASAFGDPIRRMAQLMADGARPTQQNTLYQGPLNSLLRAPSGFAHPGVLVQNIVGTTSHRCNCPGWLQHWCRYSGKIATGCSALDCDGSADVGAHVMTLFGGDRGWQIIPACKACNQRSERFYVHSATVFVSANVASTCGR